MKKYVLKLVLTTSMFIGAAALIVSPIAITCANTLSKRHGQSLVQTYKPTAIEPTMMASSFGYSHKTAKEAKGHFSPVTILQKQHLIFSGDIKLEQTYQIDNFNVEETNQTTLDISFSLKEGSWYEEQGVGKGDKQFNLTITNFKQPQIEEITYEPTTINRSVLAPDLGFSNVKAKDAIPLINEQFIIENKRHLFTGKIDQLQDASSIVDLQVSQRSTTTLRLSFNLLPGAWYDDSGPGTYKKNFGIMINNFRPDVYEPTTIKNEIDANDLQIQKITPNMAVAYISPQFIIDHKQQIFQGEITHINNPSKVVKLKVTNKSPTEVSMVFSLVQGSWYDNNGPGWTEKQFETTITNLTVEKRETKPNLNLSSESIGLSTSIPSNFKELVNEQLIMDQQANIFNGDSKITNPNQVLNFNVVQQDKTSLKMTFSLAEGTWYNQVGILGGGTKDFEIIIYFVHLVETVIMSRKNNIGVIGNWSEWGSLPEITLQFNQLIGMGNNSQSAYAIVPLDTYRNPISDEILLEALARNIEIELQFIEFSDGTGYDGQNHLVRFYKTKLLYDWVQDNSLVIDEFPEEALVPDTNMPLQDVYARIAIKVLKEELQIGDIKYKISTRDFWFEESIQLAWEDFSYFKIAKKKEE